MTLGSMFAGIGGFDLAAAKVGIKAVWQIEKDKFCQEILRKHYPKAKLYGDIKEIKAEELATVDIISSGFPCQPFSAAGKRQGKKDYRYLWPENIRVIKNKKPTWFIAENVSGFIGMALDECCADLEAEGYEVWPLVIPACAVNAPHRRDRVWIIANNKIKRHKRTYLSKKTRKKEWRVTARYFKNETWIEAATRFCRVDDGFPNRVHRIKALGNAIVHQIAIEIFVSIIETERQIKYAIKNS